jgi:hypothetical protein
MTYFHFVRKDELNLVRGYSTAAIEPPPYLRAWVSNAIGPDATSMLSLLPLFDDEGGAVELLVWEPGRDPEMNEPHYAMTVGTWKVGVYKDQERYEWYEGVYMMLVDPLLVQPVRAPVISAPSTASVSAPMTIPMDPADVGKMYGPLIGEAIRNGVIGFTDVEDGMILHAPGWRVEFHADDPDVAKIFKEEMREMFGVGAEGGEGGGES